MQDTTPVSCKKCNKVFFPKPAKSWYFDLVLVRVYLDTTFYLTAWWGVGGGQGMSHSRQGNMRSAWTKCSEQHPNPLCMQQRQMRPGTRSCSRSELQRWVRALRGGTFEMACWNRHKEERTQDSITADELRFYCLMVFTTCVDSG